MKQKKKDLILIVDDNVHNLQVLGSILAKEGYGVAVAENGHQVLDFVKKKIPQLILMDIVMPGLDGIEVCKILKKEEKTKDIPIIFLSVHKDTHEKIAAFNAGGVDYITKPFQREEVLARVKVHLELVKTKQELKKANEELEVKVFERTKELRESNKKLEEINIALKVLLEKKEEQSKEYKESFVYNVKNLLEPYIEKLKETDLTVEQKVLINLIEKKLAEIVSPYEKDLSEKYGLTPTEIQVIDLIKSGKQTKEIAEIMGLSKRTVDTHRHNIRKKLGILNKNINLRSYLSSLEKNMS